MHEDFDCAPETFELEEGMDLDGMEDSLLYLRAEEEEEDFGEDSEHPYGDEMEMDWGWWDEAEDFI